MCYMKEKKQYVSGLIFHYIFRQYWYTERTFNRNYRTTIECKPHHVRVSKEEEIKTCYLILIFDIFQFLICRLYK